METELRYPTKDSLLKSLIPDGTTPNYEELNWRGSFDDYLEMIQDNPKIVRTAFQRIYDMILSYGVEEIREGKDILQVFRFFSDPKIAGEDTVFGLEKPLMELVGVLKGASESYGVEKRLLLLHGPVGSSKSTIVRRLKKGLEEYSRTDEGALYTFGWMVGEEVLNCPMHEEPLNIVPEEIREDLESKLSTGGHGVKIHGKLCPFCKFYFNDKIDEYGGDWIRVLGDVVVNRLILSEDDRVGIGTFQPKDEKNQDSTELTGDINYRKIAQYGTDSDPRAFNFDGEFNIANRGIIEFIEMLKLDVRFLYDLLGASQEHSIKPKKFAQIHIDEVIIGHTNAPEYRKLQNDEFMEALRDRTIRIDIPYVTKLSDEINIYKKDYNPKKVKKHIAPHTIEIASLWAILTRLSDPKEARLTLLQKLKLYNGKTLPGFTEESIRELKQEAPEEGMEGISPRYLQDKITNALVSDVETTSINPFMVLNELEEGLRHHSLIDNEDMKKRFKELLGIAKEEYEDIVKTEVQRAIAADDDALDKLCGNYIDNLKAYTQKERVRNKFTGRDEEPDERLMRSVEEKIDIPEARKEDFRRQIMNYIGALALEGETFDFRSNERLQKALELKLFEDQKDTIKLSSVVSNVVDKETQDKIDIVKARLINNYGYNDESATDVLNFVASIFARGEIKKN